MQLFLKLDPKREPEDGEVEQSKHSRRAARTMRLADDSRSEKGKLSHAFL
jgi:hypothetical protein